MDNDFQWRARLDEVLDSTHYCALATTGLAGTWVNPVFFAPDDDLSLLFISLQESLHMHNIDYDDRVAIAIFSTDQPPGEHVQGIQLRGKATKLTDDQVPDACRTYFSRPGASAAIGESDPDPVDYMGDAPDTWKFVRIRPTEIHYFGSEHFGDKRVVVPDDVRR